MKAEPITTQDTMRPRGPLHAGADDCPDPGTPTPTDPGTPTTPGTPEPKAGPVGTRVSLPLTPRGAKFASNSTDDGATVKVTRAEARVLLAEKMVGLPPPTLTSFAPTSGLPSTTITIAGVGFGARGANSQVTIGGVVQPIQQWQPDLVWVTATRGANVIGTPYPVVLRTQAMTTLACGNFTFTAP